jgi:methyl-accepting chemotaxis protein
MKWPLRRKLFLAFGSLIALVLALGTITFQRLNVIEDLESQRDAMQEIALHAEQMRSSVLMSRRHEKDFFMRGGDEKYLKQQHERFAEFDVIVEETLGIVGTSRDALRKLVNEAKTQHAAYRESFDAAAKAFRTAGTHEYGLESEFRAAAHEIEDIAERRKDRQITLLILQMRRAEKDYLMREEMKYRDLVHQFANELRDYVSTSPEPSTPQLLALVLTYLTKFEANVKAHQDVARLRGLLHEATESTDAALSRFQEQSAVAKQAILAESTQTHRDARFMIVSMFLATILLAAGVARAFSNQLTRAVSVLLEGTKRIADGDLTVRVAATTSDELGELSRSFNDMAGALGNLSSNIRSATSSLKGMVEELQATVAEQGASIQQQASSVAETVATVEELSRSSNEVSATAGSVLAKATQSIETSERGRSAIDQSIASMNDVREQVQSIAATILDLSEKTQQISSIIATVDDFAEQSSLLALNASIEAARAGEDGRAFSVVAGEVKNLAEQSQRATERVRSILNDIRQTTHTAVMVTEEGSKRVDRGVQLVGEAGRIIGDLTGSILDSAESAKQIAGAAQQQSSGIGQISIAMSGIDGFSKQNLDAIKQTAGASQTLASVAGQLSSTAQRYQL